MFSIFIQNNEDTRWHTKAINEHETNGQKSMNGMFALPADNVEINLQYVHIVDVLTP